MNFIVMIVCFTVVMLFQLGIIVWLIKRITHK